MCPSVHKSVQNRDVYVTRGELFLRRRLSSDVREGDGRQGSKVQYCQESCSIRVLMLKVVMIVPHKVTPLFFFHQPSIHTEAVFLSAS